MAEASMSIPSSRSQRFFCHKCRQEINHVNEDFTCPICNGGFIEEMQDEDPPSGASSSTSFDVQGQGPPGMADFFNLLTGLPVPPPHGGASFRFQGGGGGGPGGGTFQRTRSEGSGSSTPTGGGGGGGNHFQFVIGPGGARGGRGSNPNIDNPMEQVLFTFLNDLVNGLSGGAMGGAMGGPVITNLGDYAWGRDGLDAIVTQLMNQMEGTGPPPLAKEKIETLPDVKICKEHVDRHLQCSVCWDDFKLDEIVKKVECDHLYHPDCIVPWLKLHGTCPICRKDLSGQVQDDGNTSSRHDPDGRSQSSEDSSSTSSRDSQNRRTDHTYTSSSRANNPGSGRSGRRHSSENTNPTTNHLPNSGSNPLMHSISQALEPVLAGFGVGLPNPTRTHPHPSNDDSSSTGSRSSDRQHRSQSGHRQPRSGSGGQDHQDLNHMDMEFD